MNRNRLALACLAALAITLILAPSALASAGGGSAGFSGGGGGGSGGHGSGFALYIIIQLLIRIALLGHGIGALVLIGLAIAYFLFTRGGPAMSEWWASRSGSKRKTSQRERRVELAAAEAAEEDPEFAPDTVRATAKRLFMDIQTAWDADDRVHLRGLVAPELLNEWERRLDDFERRGWHNHVEVVGDPTIEYVGLKHTGNHATDRVTVRVDARLKDYVVDTYGRHLKRQGRLGETVRVHEFWTLQRRAEHHWVLASIEQGAEGQHALDEKIVATDYSDETGMRDEAMIEGAVSDAVPAGTKIAEVADLQFEGDAHSAANDLSLADGRFAPDVLEIAARRAVDAWAQAVDGDPAVLSGLATSEATSELLYGAGGSAGRARIVVRGPVVNRIRIIGLDAGAEPPTMTVEVDITGRRYLEDRDTTAVLAGSRSRATSFTERWTFALTDDQSQPWRITAAAAPVGLA
jgi:predicted lipid-binding transport protein (Tim44 family)